MSYSKSDSRSLTIILGIAALLIALVIGLSIYNNAKPGIYNAFAQCIKDSGTVFYGAFWCPHCQSQKKLFGSSEKYLPYVECSTPDGRNQTAFCDERGVEGYPTWTFPDGSKLSGEVPLLTLSEKTGCPISPESSSTLQLTK